MLYRDAAGTGVTLAPPPARSRWPEAVALVLFAIFVLRPAFRERPRAQGDSGEYFLTAESLLNHATPFVHAQDLDSLGEAARRYHLEGAFGRVLSLHLAGPDGRIQGIHFWAYPLATLPMRGLLRVLGENELKAPQITNALLLLLALLHVLFRSRLPPFAARVFAAGLVLSPLLPFVLWPHPEVFSAALTASALVFRHDGRPVPAVLCAALASTQNAPLLLLAACLLAGAFPSASCRDRARLVLAFAPALVPPLLALSTLGAPSVLMRAGAADPANLSVRRALDLLFDPDVGLLPYAPLTLLVAGAAVVARPSRPLLEDAALLCAGAFACTFVTNWNSGTSGPSRYGVWLLPLAVDAVARAAAWPSPAFRAAAALAVATQAAIAIGRGGPHAPDDHLRHSPLATFLLDRRPSLYEPDGEVFVERTLGREGPPAGPVVFRAGGRCRKALVQKRHRAELRETCGQWKSGPDFRVLIAREGKDAWAYVDY